MIVIAAFGLVVWVAAIVALAGGGPGGGSGADGGRREPGEARGQARTPDGGGGERGGGEPGKAEGARAGDGSGEAPSGDSSEEELEDAAEEALSEPPGGGVPEGEVPIEDEEGRSNGQRGFVASFVGAAYGYTGSDVGEYRAGYESRIDPGAYYRSAGGEVLKEYAALVRDGGAENAAVLKDYRITSGEPVETEVNASELAGFAPRGVRQGPMPEGASISEVTYAVGDRYGDPSKGEDFGKVYGEVDYLAQRLFLSREEGSGWKILAASAPRQTRNPNADRPPAGAPKVAEPAGPGGHSH